MFLLTELGSKRQKSETIADLITGLLSVSVELLESVGDAGVTVLCADVLAMTKKRQLRAAWLPTSDHDFPQKKRGLPNVPRSKMYSVKAEVTPESKAASHRLGLV